MMKSSIGKFNLKEIDRKLGRKFWSPLNVASINDWVLRAAAVKGEFHWHRHRDDEFFLVQKGGPLVIETEDGPIKLKKGEGTVIPKGMKHRPRSAKRTLILLLEPKRVNTQGD